MANISLRLSDFKASGVYLLEHDLSESIQLNTNTVRLVVGFSRKGVFNTPVFCRDSSDFNRVFGSIDTFLERRGSFFHRSAYKCLEVGPILALNLLALNNDPTKGEVDVVPYQSFSINTVEKNGTKKNELYQSYYNRQGF